jgi:hypothetical protein
VGELVLREPLRLGDDFRRITPGCVGGLFLAFMASPSVVVDDLNVVGLTVREAKNDSVSAPNFKPLQDSPALVGAAPTPGGFFETASFVGAIGATDWTQGWTAFPANQARGFLRHEGRRVLQLRAFLFAGCFTVSFSVP